MKSMMKKILALVLSLVLIAVPLSTVMAQSPDEEPVVSETPEDQAEEGSSAILDLLDEFTFDLALIENSSLPDFIKELLMKAIGSYDEFTQGLVHEDGTPMTDEEALEYLIGEMVTMIVTLVNMVIQIVNMATSMAAAAEGAAAEAEAAA